MLGYDGLNNSNMGGINSVTSKSNANLLTYHILPNTRDSPNRCAPQIFGSHTLSQ